MWLDETKYPPADACPEVNGLGWVQYNLDRHASVAEVLANAEAVRPTSRSGLQHYLVADATGDAAAIEFLEGKLVVHRGAAMPVKALANSTYTDSVAAFERAKSKGEVPISSSSLDRFSRGAILASGATTCVLAFPVWSTTIACSCSTCGKEGPQGVPGDENLVDPTPPRALRMRGRRAAVRWLGLAALVWAVLGVVARVPTVQAALLSRRADHRRS